MPFYEYSCTRCGHHHEELQKVSDPPLRKCPECGRLSLKRLMSAPVFRLKGGGWYETDFKSDQEGKRNLAGEKEPAEAKTDAAEKGKETVAKPAEPVKGKEPEAGKAPAAGKPAAGKIAPAVRKRVKPKAAPQRAKPAARKAASRRPR